MARGKYKRLREARQDRQLDNPNAPFRLMERAYVAFRGAGERLQKEKPEPESLYMKYLPRSKDLEDLQPLRVRFCEALDNPILSLQEATELVKKGLPMPVVKPHMMEIFLQCVEEFESTPYNDYMGRLSRLSLKADENGDMSFAEDTEEAGREAKPRRKLVDVIRKNGGDEREVTLARIHDVFQELNLPWNRTLAMTDQLMGAVIEGSFSLNYANILLDHPDEIRRMGLDLERGLAFQRRATLASQQAENTILFHQIATAHNRLGARVKRNWTRLCDWARGFGMK